MRKLFESNKNLHIDAVYKRHKLNNMTKCADYTQVIRDFEIPNLEVDQRLIVITSFELDPDELKTRNRDEILFVESG